MKLVLTQTDPSITVNLGLPAALPAKPVQQTQTASTSTTALNPAGLTSIVLTLAASTTIDIGTGYAGQTLRVEIKQDGTGGWLVALGSSIVTGSDIASYAVSSAANMRDLLMFVAASPTAWMLVAVNKGFGV